MPLFYKAKKLDFTAGERFVVVLNRRDAYHSNIRAGDKIRIFWQDDKGKKFKVIVVTNLTRSKVKLGEIGFYRELWHQYKVRNGELVEARFLGRPKSIIAIRKKLLGKQLDYKEIDSIVKDIVSGRIGHTEITYFVASGFIKDYSNEELYYLTKSIAENGDVLRFRGKVVDKHSIGGLPANRTTMIVAPIIAACGLCIPKTSSRAITSPAGTADTMEVLANVSFTVREIKKLVQKNKGCLVWGGGLNLAPADDRVVQVSYPLGMEPYTKMVVSIMAKKVASDVEYLVIDLPFGPTTKVPNIKVAKRIEKKFLYLGKRFGIKVSVVMSEALEPVGRGVGPALEARDVLRVLQQDEFRPLDLENKSLRLAGRLLEIAGEARLGKGEGLARDILESGAAWRKMKAMIKSQGGKPSIKPQQLILGAFKKHLHASQSGKVIRVDNKAIVDLCRILGAPMDKKAGIYMNKRYGEEVFKGDRTLTLYAESEERMQMAIKALGKIKVLGIKK
ncbi:AMP phosphorylase [Patescibacteria group bacterium]|nr:AMP phosphorylase [Patescibacteria group bacterium]MBU4511706.1 AMP phosphorylase [Patescibacteria group bacterium]MCG2692959.1 AMP phosphorylase [Candidatus Parcubacteria bacterium]